MKITRLALSIASGGERSNLPLGLFMVADGMGGHQYGELASAIAVRSIAGFILKKLHPYLLDPTYSLDEPLQEIMRASIAEAQRNVLQNAPGSGTTITAALVFGQQVTIGHVGDSRAYAFHEDGRVELLTRDHSLVKRLEELGQISSEEALNHPQRNVLYRALGQGETLEADVFTMPFPKGYLVLCSDGLWGVVPEDKMFDIAYTAPDLYQAAQRLVQTANDAGGPDNISVILVRLLDG
ncbi:MAG: protein phosphatase 2C domain-containing protein [Anaerolineales bacterium]|nr:protein phosphatase 2C domain-containing protein [Anaerolineales bacterium]